jgi:DNA-binding transcriptional MerR regulator
MMQSRCGDKAMPTADTLTAPEVARMLGVSRMQVHRLARAGLLGEPTIVGAGRWRVHRRYSRAVIETILAGRETIRAQIEQLDREMRSR